MQYLATGRLCNTLKSFVKICGYLGLIVVPLVGLDFQMVHVPFVACTCEVQKAEFRCKRIASRAQAWPYA